MRKTHRHKPAAEEEAKPFFPPRRPFPTPAPAPVTPEQSANRVRIGHTLEQSLAAAFRDGGEATLDLTGGLGLGHTGFSGHDSAAQIAAAMHISHSHPDKHGHEALHPDKPEAAPPHPAPKPNFGHDFSRGRLHRPDETDDHSPLAWLHDHLTAWRGVESSVADAVGPLPSPHQLAEAAGETFAPLTHARTVPEALRAEGRLLRGGMQQNAAGVRDWATGLEAGVDRQEADWTRQNAGGHGVAPDAYGHVTPDLPSQIKGGLEKGLVGLASGAAGVAADPWDAAGGLYSVAEHVPTATLPVLGGNAFREAHDLERVLASGRDAPSRHAAMEQMTQDVSHPGRHNKEDMSFLQGAWAGATESYNQAGEAGKPWEAVSRLGLDVASFFVEAGEARAGVTAAKAGQGVNDLAKTGQTVNDMAKTGDAASDLARAEGLRNAATHPLVPKGTAGRQTSARPLPHEAREIMDDRPEVTGASAIPHRPDDVSAPPVAGITVPTAGKTSRSPEAFPTVSNKVAGQSGGTFRLNRKRIDGFEKIVGKPEAVVEMDAGREAYAAELASRKANVEKVYMGQEADRFINVTGKPGSPKVGECQSCDVVAVTKKNQFMLSEAKGKNIEHGLEQLEHSASQLGPEQVTRSQLVVPERLQPGYKVSKDGTLLQCTNPDTQAYQEVLIHGKPVHVIHTSSQ